MATCAVVSALTVTVCGVPGLMHCWLKETVTLRLPTFGTAIVGTVVAPPPLGGPACAVVVGVDPPGPPAEPPFKPLPAARLVDVVVSSLDLAAILAFELPPQAVTEAPSASTSTPMLTRLVNDIPSPLLRHEPIRPTSASAP